MPALLPLKFMASFFIIIIVKHTHTHISIYKYNALSHLVVKLGVSSLGEANSLSLRCQQLSVALCPRWDL